jgi:hypothetical protein
MRRVEHVARIGEIINAYKSKILVKNITVGLHFWHVGVGLLILGLFNSVFLTVWHMQSENMTIKKKSVLNLFYGI